MNGTYDFVCEPHAAFGMVGQIIVETAPPVVENNSSNETNLNVSTMGEDTLPSLSIGLTLCAVGASSIAFRRNH